MSSIRTFLLTATLILAGSGQAIADVLTKLGFEVDLLLDGDRKKMHKAIRGFGDELRKGGVGLFLTVYVKL